MSNVAYKNGVQVPATLPANTPESTGGLLLLNNDMALADAIDSVRRNPAPQFLKSMNNEVYFTTPQGVTPTGLNIHRFTRHGAGPHSNTRAHVFRIRAATTQSMSIVRDQWNNTKITVPTPSTNPLGWLYIDGVLVHPNEYVLIKNQSNTALNNLYKVGYDGASIDHTTMSYNLTTFDQGGSLPDWMNGQDLLSMYVRSGTVNSGLYFNAATLDELSFSHIATAKTFSPASKPLLLQPYTDRQGQRFRKVYSSTTITKWSMAMLMQAAPLVGSGIPTNQVPRGGYFKFSYQFGSVEGPLSRTINVNKYTWALRVFD